MVDVYVDGRVVLSRAHFEADEAAAIFQALVRDTAWLEVSYGNAGKRVALPRLTANYGERSYDYGGLAFTPVPWTPLLERLRGEAETLAGVTFNAAIVQRYRNGRDRVRWHADDSPAVGRNPVIVSMSFGATRRFLVKPIGAAAPCLALALAGGDLLVMRGDLQHTHLHCVPREPTIVEPRVNVTFRAIVADRPAEHAAHHMQRTSAPTQSSPSG